MKPWYKHGFHTVNALRLVFFSMRIIPRFVQPAVAAVTALVFFVILKRERNAVRRNLHRVTGRTWLRLNWSVYKVFYSFCDLMVSYCFVPGASDAELLSMLADSDRGQKVIDACLARGKGVVVWTAHLGNPEIASRLLELHGRLVNVARVVEDKPAERLLRERMISDRLRVVDLSSGAQATIELLQALRRNEIVAIQGDRVYNPHHVATLHFFGKETSFPSGPFLLARAAGAPVLPGVVVRQGWLKYRALLGEPIEPNTEAGMRDPVTNELQHALSFLEPRLVLYHQQWANFFDFWQVESVDGSG